MLRHDHREFFQSGSIASPADDASHLLIIDDDTRIRSLLSQFLRTNGYRVTTAESAADARRRMEGLSFDLIVLDLMMPGENGFQFAQTLRLTSSVPILMLTALADVNDRIRGLEIGVDDYLAKPFDPRELLLRISSILRRVSAPPPKNGAVPESVQFGPFHFHIARGELLQDGEVIKLTDRERDMMRVLAEAHGAAVPREALAGRTPRRTNARWTCRSTVCAARSSGIRPIQSSCKRCGDRAIA